MLLTLQGSRRQSEGELDRLCLVTEFTSRDERGEISPIMFECGDYHLAESIGAFAIRQGDDRSDGLCGGFFGCSGFGFHYEEETT